MLDIFDDRHYPYDCPSDDFMCDEVWWEDQVIYLKSDCRTLVIKYSE